jgi:hypothetical protein
MCNGRGVPLALGVRLACSTSTSLRSTWPARMPSSPAIRAAAQAVADGGRCLLLLLGMAAETSGGTDVDVGHGLVLFLRFSVGFPKETARELITRSFHDHILTAYMTWDPRWYMT